MNNKLRLECIEGQILVALIGTFWLLRLCKVLRLSHMGPT